MPTVFRPDPDRVRRRLANVLREARAAETLPWPDSTLRMYRQIVPQMVKALPDDEAARIVAEFEAELARLCPMPEPFS